MRPYVSVCAQTQSDTYLLNIFFIRLQQKNYPMLFFQADISIFVDDVIIWEQENAVTNCKTTSSCQFSVFSFNMEIYTFDKNPMTFFLCMILTPKKRRPQTCAKFEFCECFQCRGSVSTPPTHPRDVGLSVGTHFFYYKQPSCLGPSLRFCPKIKQLASNFPG